MISILSSLFWSFRLAVDYANGVKGIYLHPPIYESLEASTLINRFNSQIFFVPRESGCELVGTDFELLLVIFEGLDELGDRTLDSLVDIREDRDLEILHFDLGDVVKLE